ncbi:MAG: family 43 glycosylhydrolase [Bacteroidetes bacterium]|nr:family 43 glycosylhydrolase [Bacteroidota bacterium]
MKKRFLLLGLLSASFLFLHAQQNAMIRPGEIWKDIDGNPINAHGGGVLFHNNTYYWFGEIKKGKTWRVPGVTSWEDYRVDASGISCYSSKDLLHWKYEGIALSPDKKNSTSDIHYTKVIERPKVIYNDKTKKFVMWMHIDKDDYGYAHAGVAISDKPEGPYRYLGSEQPNGQMSRDMTLFKDDDGKAYHIYSSESNQTMHICLLSDDYLKPTATYKRILVNANREAPALFKYKGKYYLITSLCTGWDPNKALYAEADHPLGEWKQLDNPCVGPDADITYHAQSTYVLPVEGKNNSFIFMADRWNKTDLEDSRYIWLPLVFKDNKPVIEWKDQWTPAK